MNKKPKEAHEINSRRLELLRRKYGAPDAWTKEDEQVLLGLHRRVEELLPRVTQEQWEAIRKLENDFARRSLGWEEVDKNRFKYHGWSLERNTPSSGWRLYRRVGRGRTQAVASRARCSVADARDWAEKTILEVKTKNADSKV